jgi:hypothetical protein
MELAEELTDTLVENPFLEIVVLKADGVEAHLHTVLGVVNQHLASVRPPVGSKVRTAPVEDLLGTSALALPLVLAALLVDGAGARPRIVMKVLDAKRHMVHALENCRV